MATALPSAHGGYVKQLLRWQQHFPWARALGKIYWRETARSPAVKARLRDQSHYWKRTGCKGARACLGRPLYEHKGRQWAVDREFQRGKIGTNPRATPPIGKIGPKNTTRIRQNPIFVDFWRFRQFWFVFGVPEVQDPLKKFPGGDAFQFHRMWADGDPENIKPFHFF